MYLLEVYFQPVFLYLLYSWMRHVCFHITKQFNLNLYALVMGRCCQNLVKGGQLSLLNTTSFRNITGEQLKSELQQELLIWDTFAISIWQYMKLSLHETCMKLMCSSTCAENAEQKLNLYETCMKLLCSSTSAENAEQVVGQFICHPNAWSWVKWNEHKHHYTWTECYYSVPQARKKIMAPLDSISLSNDRTQFHCIFAVTIFQSFRLQNPYINANLSW